MTPKKRNRYVRGAGLILLLVFLFTAAVSAVSDGAPDAEGAPAETESAVQATGGTALDAVGDYRCIMSADGDVSLYTPESDAGTVLFTGPGLLAVCRDGLWGYIGRDFTWAVEPKYEEATAFCSYGDDSGRAVVKDEEGWCIIDPDGNVKKKLSTYKTVSGFVEGLAKVTADGKSGFIGTDGKLAVATEWDVVGTPSCGRIAVCKDGKWGYINYSGTSVAPCRYVSAQDFVDGYALAFVENEEGGKTGILLDTYGNELVTGVFSTLSNGLALIQDDESGLWGFCNASGDRTPETFWTEAALPSEDRIPFRDGENGLWGFADLNGTTVITPAFDAVRPFREGMAMTASRNGTAVLYGFTDMSGTQKVQPVYAAAKDFCEGYAAVYDGNAWGYIGKNGTVMLPCRYDYAGCFSDGVAVVGVNGRFSLIGKDGRTVEVLTAGEAAVKEQERAAAEAAAKEQAADAERRAAREARNEKLGKAMRKVLRAVLIILILLVLAVLFLRWQNVRRKKRMAARRRAAAARQHTRNTVYRDPFSDDGRK